MIEKELQEYLKFKLKEDTLWCEFFQVGNEMIITKNGRCLFPLLRFAVELKKEAEESLLREMFYVSIVMQPLDNCRWKFVGGKWRTMGNGGELCDEKSDRYLKSVQASGSPMTLRNLVTRELSFAKLKLTNNQSKAHEPNHIMLTSFRYYQPNIILQRVTGDMRRADEIVGRWPVEKAEFIAVTHYQNPRICDMKKSFNPHAKGFLNVSSELSTEASSEADSQQQIEKVPLDGKDYTAVFLLNSLRNKLSAKE